MLVACGMALVGCRTLPAVRQPSEERFGRTVAMSYGAAWDRALTTGLRLGYTLISAEQEEGRLVFEREDPGARVPEYAAGTGRYVGVTWWRLHTTLHVLLKPIMSERARVSARTDLTAEAAQLDPAHRNGAGLAVLPLSSDGTLERLYLDEVALTLNPEAEPSP